MFLPRLEHDDDEDSPESARSLSFLREAVRTPLPRGKDILVVAMPAPFEALEAFLRVAPREEAFLWRSKIAQLAGAGSVVKFVAHGKTRVAQLRKQTVALWPTIEVRSLDNDPVSPAIVGGVAFADGVPEVEPWSELGVDMLMLPRWTYRRAGENAHLLLAFTRDDLANSAKVEELVDRTYSILVALSREAPTSQIQQPEIGPEFVHHQPLPDWIAYIEAIKAAIQSGAFQKIVAARRCVIDLPFKLDELILIARLFAAYSDCTHFSVMGPSTTFFGATPETLFCKTGRTVRTHALAGTIKGANDIFKDASEGAVLAQSGKDLLEHALVVKTIVDEMTELSTKVRYSSSPKVRRVRDLIHLQTPIAGELRDGVDAFDLIFALHPTPAVSGFPTKDARRWIVENEPIERGWYTGTVGWMDGRGDAEFAVAIRCGVLTRQRLYVYAGAGIVGESDATSEYNETRAKMSPLLRALGVLI